MPELKELRILPPMAIARFGSSSEPMHNYEAKIDEENIVGFRKLIPTETFIIDQNTGEIGESIIPDKISFRDENGFIKPVSPFFEVWARFDDNDFLEPLTNAHLSELGTSSEQIHWQVKVGNHKIFRRTGAENDKIEADSGLFSDHNIHNLEGHSVNFKTGKHISLGTVQFIKPNDVFSELRLRFTPAKGKVYGHRGGDPNIVDDVYDSVRGQWDTHNDSSMEIPPVTNPFMIYARDNDGRSLGYLDDSCDGIIRVELTVNEQTFSNFARVTVGPPDFAPDSFHLRTVADEIQQMLFGLKVEETISVDQARDLIRRALETMRLMNTDYWNLAYGGNLFRDNPNDPNSPAPRAKYVYVKERHEQVLTQLKGLDSNATTVERQRAVGMLSLIESILRNYDEVVNRSIGFRQKMPPFMRGSDALDVAVTRRQLSILRKAVKDFSQPSPEPPQANPAEADFLRVITELNFGKNRHTKFNLENGGKLSDLFDDPPALLGYLKMGKARGSFAGDILGQPLIIPGDSASSAFIKLLEKPGHPMQIHFDQVDSTTQKKRIDITSVLIRN